MPDSSIQTISVIVPKNPFVGPLELGDVKHCLAALDVAKLMQWWPGQPHTPHRDKRYETSNALSIGSALPKLLAIYFNEKSLTHQINWISFFVISMNRRNLNQDVNGHPGFQSSSDFSVVNSLRFQTYCYT